MTDHVEVVVSLLDGTVYDTNVPTKPVLPYKVVTAPEIPQRALALDRSDSPVDGLFRVTCVGADAAEARAELADARASLDGARPTVSGWNVHIALSSAGDVTVDRDVTLPGTGHPIYGVDVYRYRATPAPILGS